MVKCEKVFIEKYPANKDARREVRADLVADTKDEVYALGDSGLNVDGLKDTDKMVLGSTCRTVLKDNGVLSSSGNWFFSNKGAYEVSVLHDENTTVTGSGVFSVGANVTVVATPNAEYTDSEYTVEEGYKYKKHHVYSFSHWEKDGEIVSTDAEYTFKLLEEDVTLTAIGTETITAVEEQYQVTISNDGNVTTNPEAGSIWVYKGATVSVQATANATHTDEEYTIETDYKYIKKTSYSFDSIIVNGVSYSESTVVFDVDSATTVQATGTAIEEHLNEQYLVTVNVDSNLKAYELSYSTDTAGYDWTYIIEYNPVDGPYSNNFWLSKDHKVRLGVEEKETVEDDDWTTEGSYRYKNGTVYRFSQIAGSDGTVYTNHNIEVTVASALTLSATGTNAVEKVEEQYQVTITNDANTSSDPVAGTSWQGKNSVLTVTPSASSGYVPLIKSYDTFEAIDIVIDDAKTVDVIGLDQSGAYDPSNNYVLSSSWADLKTNNAISVTDGVLTKGSSSSAINDKVIVIDSEVTKVATFPGGTTYDALAIYMPDTVTVLSSSCFSSHYKLKHVRLSNSLTEIPESAFYYDRELVDIYIPDGVTTIVKNAFQQAAPTGIRYSKLNKVRLPASLTSIGNNAFYNCISLKKVNFNEALVLASIGTNAFKNTGLEYIYFASGITTIDSSAFEACTSLIGVSFDSNSQITELGHVFEGCTALKSVMLPSSLVTLRSGTFKGCTSINSVYVPWNSSNLTTVGLTTDASGVFENCTSLNLDPDTEFPSSVTTIGKYAFKNTGITSLTLRSSFTDIGTEAFANCVNLTDLDILSGFTTQSDNDVVLRKLVGGMCSGCTSLSHVKIRSDITKYNNNTFKNLTGLTSIVYTGNTDIVSIGSSVFSGCTSIAKISDVLPSTVKSIGASAFENCTGITEFDLPASVESLGNYAFDACTGLTEVDLSNKSVSTLGTSPFRGCSNVRTFNTGDLLNDLTNVMSLTQRCATVIIGKAITSIVSQAFLNNTNLTGVLFSQESALTEIASEAFKGCSNLKSIELPSTLTSLGNSAFRECSNLVSANIPTGLISIPNYAFYYCKLQSIVIPDNIQSIGSFAFQTYNGASQITIGSGVTTINRNAFDGQRIVDDITIPDTVATIDSNAFRNVKHITYHGSATGSPWGALAVN